MRRARRRSCRRLRMPRLSQLRTESSNSRPRPTRSGSLACLDTTAMTAAVTFLFSITHRTARLTAICCILQKSRSRGHIDDRFCQSLPYHRAKCTNMQIDHARTRYSKCIGHYAVLIIPNHAYKYFCGPARAIGLVCVCVCISGP